MVSPVGHVGRGSIPFIVQRCCLPFSLLSSGAAVQLLLWCGRRLSRSVPFISVGRRWRLLRLGECSFVVKSVTTKYLVFAVVVFFRERGTRRCRECARKTHPCNPTPPPPLPALSSRIFRFVFVFVCLFCFCLFVFVAVQLSLFIMTRPSVL